MAAGIGTLFRTHDPPMPETYLQTAYKDRERVKGLGARWDPARKQWYVPEGRDLAPFATWLLAEQPTALSTLDSTAGTELALPTKGVSLSQLLAGVAQAVAQAYRAGEWVRVEVVKADVRRNFDRFDWCCAQLRYFVTATCFLPNRAHSFTDPVMPDT